MIKRADDNRNFFPSLTAAKPRAGVQPISRLVELLIKQYEIQDQMRQQAKHKPAPVAELKTDRSSQATFAWFE